MFTHTPPHQKKVIACKYVTQTTKQQGQQKNNINNTNYFAKALNDAKNTGGKNANPFQNV